MSDTTSAGQPAKGGGRNDVAIIAVIGVVLVGLIWLLSGGAERPVQRDATGFDGVAAWYRHNDIEARVFEGGGSLVRGKVALRVLPLFDTDLNNERERPDTREQVLAQTSEIDIRRGVVNRKTRLQPTLVILPKWRAGMRKLNVAHKIMLIPEQEINRVAGQVTGVNWMRSRRDPDGFSTRRYSGSREDIGLMHAQTLGAGLCTPIIGTREHMLLGECPTHETLDDGGQLGSEDQKTFLLLADPDLLNNHGLKWAENGAVALEIAERFDLDQPVIVDLTPFTVTVDNDWRARRHERTWDDFSRMFAWPFTMIWLAFFFVGGLVLWRAIKRYGPLRRIYEDEPRASKEVSIDAKARLLRMSNHDAPLLAGHIQARLAHLAAELLGPHRPADRDSLDILKGLVGRKSPALAQELADASVPPGGDLPPAEILQRLDRFESCYDKVMHEFGRPTGAG